MTTTTDLLREIAQHIRAEARILRESHSRFPDFDPDTMEPEVREVYDRELRYADALDALADQMERAEHDFNVCDLDGPARRWAHKQRMTDETKLYAHPAPEVTRDAERWKREAEALWLCVAECAQALRDGVVNIPKLRAALDNVQEPKP